MRIKPGHGFWNVTHYPYGGNFNRAGDDGIEIIKINAVRQKYKDGSPREYNVDLIDNRKACVMAENTEGELLA